MPARAGHLKAGDPAPDFELPTLDHSRTVRLSSEYRSKPVALIFGSYT
jgi:peroxiredoxin